jgi:hypothetical protein
MNEAQVSEEQGLRFVREGNGGNRRKGPGTATNHRREGPHPGAKNGRAKRGTVKAAVQNAAKLGNDTGR